MLGLTDVDVVHFQTYRRAQVDLRNQERNVEHGACHGNANSRLVPEARTHEAQIGQQQTQLEAKNARDVAVCRVGVSVTSWGKEMVSYNGAPMNCSCGLRQSWSWEVMDKPLTSMKLW